MRLAPALFVVALAGMASAAQPQVSGGSSSAGGHTPRSLLWNQTGGVKIGLVDQTFSDFAAYSTYMVDDFSTAGQTWNVSSMSAFYYGGGGNWGGLTSASISFFSKSSGLPASGDVPAAYVAPITVTGDATNGYVITADLSGIAALQGISGDFWIGMTPNTSFGDNGQQFHGILAAPNFGSQAALQNPGGGFGFGTSWGDAGRLTNNDGGDMWFTLAGEAVPAPGSLSILGFGGLVATRRRRR